MGIQSIMKRAQKVNVNRNGQKVGSVKAPSNPRVATSKVNVNRMGKRESSFRVPKGM